MFIELHDRYGHPLLICVDDIQMVVRSRLYGSLITVNDQEKPVRVTETVSAIRDLIIKVGGSVAASQKIGGGKGPIPLKPV